MTRPAYAVTAHIDHLKIMTAASIHCIIALWKFWAWKLCEVACSWIIESRQVSIPSKLAVSVLLSKVNSGSLFSTRCGNFQHPCCRIEPFLDWRHAIDVLQKQLWLYRRSEFLKKSPSQRDHHILDNSSITKVAKWTWYTCATKSLLSAHHAKYSKLET